MIKNQMNHLKILQIDSNQIGLVVAGQLIKGDILISVDRVKDNAKNYKVSFNDELFRVIIHGVLHLCGFNDKTVKEKEEMRKQENFFLELNPCKSTA